MLETRSGLCLCPCAHLSEVEGSLCLSEHSCSVPWALLSSRTSQEQGTDKLRPQGAASEISHPPEGQCPLLWHCTATATPSLQVRSAALPLSDEVWVQNLVAVIFCWAHFNSWCTPSVCGSFHIYGPARTPVELPSSCRCRRHCTDCVVAFSLI